MDIEPLKVIIDLSENKMNSVVFFLNDIIKKKINSYYLYEEKNKDIFINQYIICIKKNNLSLDLRGKIISIKNNTIGIFVNNKYNKYINKNQYYLFLKNPPKKSNDRDFFENLLQNLG